MAASLPHPRIPIIDENGLITANWYRFLAQLQRDFSGSETVPGSGLTDAGGVLGIANNAIGDDKLRDSLGCSVIGRTPNSTGDPTDIQALADGRFLQRDAGVLTFRNPKLPAYTVATAPDPIASGAGTLIYVSDESGGATVAFSDGTDFRRVQDRAIIS